jgi:AraC family transcriptional regulator of adaptative response / DNA-3-methyladenine glycosylase II
VRMMPSSAIAQAWPELSTLLAPRARPEPLIERLCALPGIGPWTAHYIAMRALGWPDAFPPNDVAVLKAIRQLFDTTTQREADLHAQTWQPWRAYAVLRLWNSVAAGPPQGDDAPSGGRRRRRLGGQHQEKTTP